MVHHFHYIRLLCLANGRVVRTVDSQKPGWYFIQYRYIDYELLNRRTSIKWQETVTNNRLVFYNIPTWYGSPNFLFLIFILKFASNYNNQCFKMCKLATFKGCFILLP